MRYALIAIFLLLPSCTVIEGLKRTAATTAALAEKTSDLADKATVLLAGAESALSQTTTALAEHKAKADTDGDGKTTSDEWLTYLLGLLGLGGGGAGLFVRSALRNAKSDGRKDAIEERLKSLEKV